MRQRFVWVRTLFATGALVAFAVSGDVGFGFVFGDSMVVSLRGVCGSDLLDFFFGCLAVVVGIVGIRFLPRDYDIALACLRLFVRPTVV